MGEKSSTDDEESKETPKEIWVDYKLNERIWCRGIENPPSKIRVKAIQVRGRSDRGLASGGMIFPGYG